MWDIAGRYTETEAAASSRPYSVTISVRLSTSLDRAFTVEKNEQFHRVFLRVCLGIPRFAANATTLIEAHGCPLQHQADVRVIGPLARLHWTRPSPGLLDRFLERRSSQIGRLPVQFLQEVGVPS